MIARLSGTVAEWDEARLVIDVNGVGYEVFAPLSTTSRVKMDTAVTLHIHTVVREDAFNLYGFVTRAERGMFLLLIGVSGIGPKVALALLSGLSLADLAGAVAREDVTMLSRVNGVGKKTASRLALELKDKVGAVGAPLGTMAAGASVPTGGMGDAVSALVNLGYPKTTAEAAVRGARAESPDAPVEALIRKGLAALAKG